MPQTKRYQRQQTGFSLVELLVYFAIFSLLLVLVSQFLFEVKSLRMEAEVFQTLNREARFIFWELQKQVRSAQEIDFPGPGETGNYLSLNSGQLAYFLNAAGALERQTPTESLLLHSSQIVFDDLVFERGTNLNQQENIKIALTVKSKTSLEGEREKSLSLQTTISLR